MRFDRGETRKLDARQRRAAPRREPVGLRARAGCAAARGRSTGSVMSGARRARPSDRVRRRIGRRSPATSARPSTPPIALTRCVARLPRSGRRLHAAGDRQIRARAGATAAELQPRAARRRRPTCRLATGWPFAASRRTPRRRRRSCAARSNSSSGPISVTSSVAASAGLPTSRLASRCEKVSIGPATGTPDA